MLQNRIIQLQKLRKLQRKFSVAQVKEEYDRMKAWQVHSFGEDLQLCSARIPVIRNPTDVLVEVKATSMNPIDVAMKGGYGRNILKVFKCQELVLPLTLGRDFSGTIVDKGQTVGKDFNIGDAVYGVIPFNRDGSHAQYVVVNKCHICHKPSEITDVEAASFPYAAVTAYSALWFTGGLVYQNIRNMKILILGASGGIGTSAVQMLKASGATVIATCSLDAIPLVQRLGADLALDYKDQCYLQNVASQGKYDIILDCAQFGHKSVPQSWNYSSYITLNSPLLHNTDNYGLVGGFIYSAAELIPTNISKVKEGKLVKWAYFYPSNDAMNFITKLITIGQLSPVIDTVLSFSQIPEAYKRVSEGHIRGKVVIDMNASESQL